MTCTRKSVIRCNITLQTEERSKKKKRSPRSEVSKKSIERRLHAYRKPELDEEKKQQLRWNVRLCHLAIFYKFTLLCCLVFFSQSLRNKRLRSSWRKHSICSQRNVVFLPLELRWRLRQLAVYHPHISKLPLIYDILNSGGLFVCSLERVQIRFKKLSTVPGVEAGIVIELGEKESYKGSPWFSCRKDLMMLFVKSIVSCLTVIEYWPNVSGMQDLESKLVNSELDLTGFLIAARHIFREYFRSSDTFAVVFA